MASMKLGLFNLLRRNSNKTVPPTMIRPFTTAPPNHAIYDGSPVYNIFQLSGPQPPFESKLSKGALYVRIDMPDVGEGGVKVWIEKNTVFFKGGGGVNRWKREEREREYGGSIDLVPDSSFFKTDQVVKEVKDGVLRLVVPHKSDEEMEKQGVTRIILH